MKNIFENKIDEKKFQKKKKKISSPLFYGFSTRLIVSPGSRILKIRN